MADLVAPVTRQDSWKPLTDPNSSFSGTDALSAADAYAHKKSGIWQTSLTGSSELVVGSGVSLESNTLSFSFFGTDGTGTAPYHAIGAIWGVSKLEASSLTEYRATFLCEFELVLGAKTRDGTGGILPDGVKWVKTLNVVKDRSLFPGVRIVGMEGDAPAEMLLDGIGAWGFIVELRRRVPSGGEGSAMASLSGMYRIC